MSRPANRPEQVALFADLPEAPPAPRSNDRREAAALAEVLQALRHQPDCRMVRAPEFRASALCVENPHRTMLKTTRSTKPAKPCTA